MFRKKLQSFYTKSVYRTTIRKFRSWRPRKALDSRNKTCLKELKDEDARTGGEEGEGLIGTLRANSQYVDGRSRPPAYLVFFNCVGIMYARTAGRVRMS
ncbi:hypothetical protein GOBAR_AA31832 [Gossypium barbadense]|uniref:Uncharacterized protein n=1 Tax=Gossypium barbadense TaxID=3634 RepID=A0A2P5WCN7_GOSBA|nr:hypothetical protein GOBAR_AA31832 [Gossypium barbadense]